MHLYSYLQNKENKIPLPKLGYPDFSEMLCSLASVFSSFLDSNELICLAQIIGGKSHYPP